MELNQETLKKAYNYLSKDPCLDHLINKFSKNIDISERFNENYPLALSYLIIEQQVSFKAAITIKKRFIEKVKKLSNDEIIQLIKDHRSTTMNGILDIMRKRISDHDQYGLGEPTIQKVGKNRLIVELAGITDLEKAKAYIQRTADFEITLVKEDAFITFVENIDFS